jgi:hypothetical protein
MVDPSEVRVLGSETHVPGTTRRRRVRAWLPTVVRHLGQRRLIWFREYDRIDRWHGFYPEYQLGPVPGYWQVRYRQTAL